MRAPMKRASEQAPTSDPHDNFQEKCLLAVLSCKQPAKTDGTALAVTQVGFKPIQYAPKSWTCQFRQLKGVASESKWQHYCIYSL